MNQRTVSKSMIVIGALAIAAVVSGAGCSQQSPVQSGSTQKTDAPGAELSQERNGAAQEPRETTGGTLRSSVISGADSIVSAEIEVATQEQNELSSGDADDRAFVTSDSDSFGGVEALGSEYSYE